jgi:hypothetical protein
MDKIKQHISERAVLLFFLIAILDLSLHGQYAYIISDSALSANIRLIEGTDINNAKFIKQEKNSSIILYLKNDKYIEIEKRQIKYTPEDLKEYGLNNGRIYVSKQIEVDHNTRKVFLERLVKGKATLYYFKNENGKTFFIETDSSSLIPVYKKDVISRKIIFKEQLDSLLKDCDNTKNTIKVSSYNKQSLSSLMELYNTCELKPISFSKFGLLIGGANARIYFPSTSSFVLLQNANFDNDYSYTFGAFCDIPITRKYFYLHSEVYYLKNEFYSQKISMVFNSETQIYVNTSTINIPVIVRFVPSIYKHRPFFNLGPVFSQGIKDQYTIRYTEDVYGEDKTTDINNIEFLSKSQLGYTIGLGYQIDLTYRNVLFFEFRFSQLYPLNSKESLRKQILGLNAGFSF